MIRPDMGIWSIIRPVPGHTVHTIRCLAPASWNLIYPASSNLETRFTSVISTASASDIPLSGPRKPILFYSIYNVCLFVCITKVNFVFIDTDYSFFKQFWTVKENFGPNYSCPWFCHIQNDFKSPNKFLPWYPTGNLTQDIREIVGIFGNRSENDKIVYKKNNLYI